MNKKTLSTTYDLPSTSNVAIVHDWLVGGGAEKVVLALHELYPDAPIYTSYATPEWQKKLGNRVITGYLQYWPFSTLRKFLPVLRRQWFNSLDLSAYDVVISSAGNGEAKNIRVRPSSVHICYCHSPTHFYWRHYDQYIAHPGFGPLNPLVSFALKVLVRPLRKADYQAAQRPDIMLANSTHIQADILQYYGRSTRVIFPPVDTERFAPKNKSRKRSGFVTVGRLVPYKRTDLLVAACTQANLPLTVIGRGPELKALKRMAGPSVEFITNASDAVIEQQLQRAEAFLFAAHEDFGITPVEAMAAGTPVIAYRGGGALDYVVEKKTGIFFAEQTVAAVTDALSRFTASDYDADHIIHHAQKFSTDHFKRAFAAVLASAQRQ